VVRVVPENTGARHLEFIEECTAGNGSVWNRTWHGSVLGHLGSVRIVLQFDAVPVNAEFIRQIVHQADDYCLVLREPEGGARNLSVQHFGIRRDDSADVDRLSSGSQGCFQYWRGKYGRVVRVGRARI